MERKALPPEVKVVLIEVCGRAFWYKQPLFDMFARAGIPEEMYLKYEHEPKFKIGGQLLADLESAGNDGYLLQRRLITELCKLRNLPDSEVPDRDAGLRALRNLKEVVLSHDIELQEVRLAGNRRAEDAAEIIQKARDRKRRLTELYQAFTELSQFNRQARGYGLEDLLKELFALYEIRYRKSYKAEGEQVDGFFTFGGFDYLVEARWRQEKPSLNDLLAFKGKVNRKIESTRGVVVSMLGFDNNIMGVSA